MGTLFSDDCRRAVCRSPLEDGHIELSTRDSSSPIFTSPQTYMDGLLHYVSVMFKQLLGEWNGSSARALRILFYLV